jgi:hypothetical protein
LAVLDPCPLRRVASLPSAESEARSAEAAKARGL